MHGVLPGVTDEPTKSLWVKIKDQITLCDTVVSGCCRLPDQEEKMDWAFHNQLETA